MMEYPQGVLRNLILMESEGAVYFLLYLRDITQVSRFEINFSILYEFSKLLIQSYYTHTYESDEIKNY